MDWVRRLGPSSPALIWLLPVPKVTWLPRPVRKTVWLPSARLMDVPPPRPQMTLSPTPPVMVVPVSGVALSTSLGWLRTIEVFGAVT